jgi:hypothetical protein
MKKMIFLGSVLLLTSGAILIANNTGKAADECCDRTKCEQGVCKATDKCAICGENCMD